MILNGQEFVTILIFFLYFDKVLPLTFGSILTIFYPTQLRSILGQFVHFVNNRAVYNFIWPFWSEFSKIILKNKEHFDL